MTINSSLQFFVFLVQRTGPFASNIIWWPHGGDMSNEGFSDEKRGEWPKTHQTTMDLGMIWHSCAHCDMTPWLLWVLIF
jgi:hypothetical protein